jgi:TMEM175 potassium channel family protein
MSAIHPAGQYPKNRTEAFTDGVLAIVITLLVLELGVAAGSEDDLLQAIFDQWPSYLAYFTSFFTVGAFWLRHHAITNAMAAVDGGFIRLNLLAIFFLSFLPFPTKLVAEFLETEDATRVAVVFYGILLFLAAVSFRLLWLHVARNRELLEPETTDERVRELSESLTPSMVGYVVAILVGLVLPHLAVALYFVLAVLIALPIGTLRAALRND